MFDSHVGGDLSGSGRLVSTLPAGVTNPGIKVVDASAWTAVKSGTGSTAKVDITQSQLGFFDGGVGVTGGYDNYNNCGVGECNMHQIDNVGNTPGSTAYDFIQLTFNQAVTLTGMSRYAFGQIMGSTTVFDDDASYGRAASLADIKLNNSSASTPLTGNTSRSWTDFSSMLGSSLGSGDASTPSLTNGSCNANKSLGGVAVCYDSNTFGTTSNAYTASTTWWISAALLNPDSKSDAFKLYDFKVVYNDTPGPVPEPASWTMMIGGFGLVGGALRRKKATERLTVA